MGSFSSRPQNGGLFFSIVAGATAFHPEINSRKVVISANPRKPSGNHSALLEIFRIIRDFGDDREIFFVLPFTENHDTSIAASALKTCAGISVGSVAPILAKLLSHQDIEIKTVAYEIALKLDKEKVLRQLSSLFESSIMENRKQALLLAPILDDSSVFPLLSKIFLDDSVDDLKVRAGELLACMPSLERLKLLYSGSHLSDGTVRKGFEILWETVEQNALQILGFDKTAVETHCKSVSINHEKPEKTNDYSFQKIIASKSRQPAANLVESESSPKNVEPPNVPRKLDMDEWTLYILNQSDEINKLTALEELSVGPLSSGVARVLYESVSNDPSSVVRDAASRIIQIEKSREKVGMLSRNFQFTPEAFKALIEGADSITRQLLLKSIRKAPPKELIDLWRNQLTSEPSPEVIEAGLHLLARFGEPADANFGIAFIAFAQAEVGNAALDLLHAQNLELFKHHVGAFLESNDIRKQIHAVRRLRTVDPRDAMLFLRSLLQSFDPLVRQKALRELLLIPFSEAETAYLEFISVESQPLLLVMAGLGVAFNPDERLPLKIYNILQA
ncbi:hypothetical protein HYY75_10785, partial [bacterium]|nr:hypothetical protein [bacterium]